MGQKELIGYVLQKDFLDCEEGTLFYRIGRDEAYKRRVVLSEKEEYVYVCELSGGRNWMFNRYHIENFPKWFKPVYK